MSDNEMLFQLKFESTGVVHDKDGNVVEHVSNTETRNVTAAELAELGIEAPPHKE